MFKTSQTVTIKAGSIIPEEEALVLEKSTKLISEIKDQKAKWKHVKWIGNKPEYEWYVLGFSSDLRIGKEDIPVILITHMGDRKYQKMEQFDVSANKSEPRIVYNSIVGSAEAVTSVVKKSLGMYGSKAVIKVFKKRM